VFASYRVAILDARNGDIIASRPLLTGDGRLPWISIDASVWPKSQNDVTDAERTMLQTNLRRLIDATLAPTLERLIAGR
jgi:hypothetical protein